MSPLQTLLVVACLGPTLVLAQTALKVSTRLDDRLERLEDPPRLAPMTPRDAVQTPKAAAGGSPAAAEVPLVKIDEVIEKDHRTGLRVTSRNGTSYTLTDPINDGATRKNDGTPLSGKTAVPTWQVLKW